MQNADSLEWVVQNPPFLSLMAKRGGGSLLKGAAILCCVGIFFAWLYLSIELPGTIPFLYAPLGAAVIVAITVAIFVVVALAMRAVGFGYAYRLDADGVTFRYYFGRTPPAPYSIPPCSEREDKDASLGGFGGWALWSWLRKQGMRAETIKGLGAIVLRMEERPGWKEKDAQVIFLFCGGPERLAAVERFVGGKLR